MAVTTASLRRLTPVDSGRRRSNNGAMDDAQLKEFGVRLRRRREALNLTRVALCEKSGITRTTLRYLEQGTQHPTPHTLNALVSALATTEEALTGYAPIRPDDPLLENLTEEDLEVAQAFHHAPTRVKQRVLFTVHERRRREGSREAPEVGSVIDRILDRVRPEDYAEVVRTVLRDIDAFVEEVSAEAPEAAPQRPAAHRRPKHR